MIIQYSNYNRRRPAKLVGRFAFTLCFFFSSSLQYWFSKGGNHFVGMIISPYNTESQTVLSDIRCLTISDNHHKELLCSKFPSYKDISFLFGCLLALLFSLFFIFLLICPLFSSEKGPPPLFFSFRPYF